MRYGIYLTGTASEYTLRHHGTYADLFLDLLREPGDSWDIFDVQKGDYPNRLEAYRGIIVTGSAADAHARDPWVLQLNQAIREIFAKPIKLLGVCFGHQAVANALGGASHVNPAGWEAGLHRLRWLPPFHNQPFAAGITQELWTLQIHRDHVVRLPPGAQNLAATPQTPIQMYTVGGTVLCLQGHPEFHNDIVKDLVETRAGKGIIDPLAAKDALASLSLQPDREPLRKLLKSFLYSNH